jgi:hypothetical protein
MTGGNWLTEAERLMLQAQLADLTTEHRDLDTAIRAMEAQPMHDQLQVRRMKKRKLVLKDQIGYIERQLDPDELA